MKSLSLFGIMLVSALLAFAGCTVKKHASLCDAPSDCPAGQTCQDGGCVAIATMSDADVSVSDLGGETETNNGTEKECEDGPLRCNSEGTGFSVCENGVLLTKSCSVHLCNPVGDGRFAGIEPAVCLDGVGCVQTVCEPCLDAFTADEVAQLCRTSCSGDEHCIPGATCTEGKCVIANPKALGQSCTGDTQCHSQHCARSLVDGQPSSQSKVCCATACDGDCQSCDSSGQCGSVNAGVFDPERCVTADPSSCGLTGKCDGNGKCASWDDGTLCAGPSCAEKMQYGPSTCKGGNCQKPTGTACLGGYDCKDGLVCDNKPCKLHSECADLLPANGYFCAKNLSDAVNGICSALKDLLDTCLGQAFVGTDGDACKSAACAVQGNSGLCSGAGQCNWKGTSLVDSGSFVCEGYDVANECDNGIWKAAVNCASSICAVPGRQENSGFIAKLCDSKSGCNTTCQACLPGYIATATGCLTSCLSSAQCESTHYCKVGKDGGSCEPKRDDGVVCTADQQCKNAHCEKVLTGSGRVCCSEACANCKGCSDRSGEWKCEDKTIPLVDSDCPNNESKEPICGKSRCVAGLCAYAASGTACKTTACIDGTLHEYECDGLGECKERTTTCVFGCEGSQCKPNCTAHKDCPADKYCSKVGACTTRRLEGFHCNGSISIDGEPGNSLCVSGLSCTADNLELYDASGNPIDVAGGFFCRGADNCINATTVNGPATVYSKSAVICDALPQKNGQGLPVGVKYFICDGASWRSPTAMGQKVDICATNPSTGSYPACGEADKETGYTTGYMEMVCNAGILGSAFSDGGCQQRCKDCGGYMHISDKTSCVGSCYTLKGYRDNYCDPNYYCCTNSQCGTPKTCKLRKPGHVRGVSSAPCDRSRMCKFRCVDYTSLLGEPNCACQVDGDCPQSKAGPDYYCRCGECTTSTSTNCCTAQCIGGEVCTGAKCYKICADQTCK